LNPEKANLTVAKKVIKVFLLCIGIPILLFAIFIIVGNIDTYIHRNDWKARTSPLDAGSVAQLCSDLGLSAQDDLCNGSAPVYGPDFYHDINNVFRPYKEFGEKDQAATYAEVKAVLGPYKTDCEDVVTNGDGFTYFECNYDIRGDGEFTIGISFTYPDNLVYRIMTPMSVNG
jgi:hypothetical protein